VYSTTTFKRSWRPRYYKMACASNVSRVWYQLIFLFFFSLLLEFSDGHFNFFFLYIWSMSFLLLFFFWISYEITNVFQFHPLLFFNLLGLVPIFFITIFFFLIGYKLHFFSISPPFIFFLSFKFGHHSFDC
jgi:hypothetical protein